MEMHTDQQRRVPRWLTRYQSYIHLDIHNQYKIKNTNKTHTALPRKYSQGIPWEDNKIKPIHIYIYIYIYIEEVKNNNKK